MDSGGTRGTNKEIQVIKKRSCDLQVGDVFRKWGRAFIVLSKDSITTNIKEYYSSGPNYASFGSKSLEWVEFIERGVFTSYGVPVWQLDEHGNRLRLFDKIVDAKDISRPGGISDVINGRTKTAGGFKWARAV